LRLLIRLYPDIPQAPSVYPQSVVWRKRGWRQPGARWLRRSTCRSDHCRSGPGAKPLYARLRRWV